MRAADEPAQVIVSHRPQAPAPLPDGPGSRRRWLAWGAGAAVLLLAAVVLMMVEPIPDAAWDVDVHTAADGLPTGGVDGVAAGDDTVWAVSRSQAGLQLHRLDGDRWVAAGDPLDVRHHIWMVSDGADGVFLSVRPPRDAAAEELAERVVHFDGRGWTGQEQFSPLPDVSDSTVATGSDGTTWVVGYAQEGGHLVVGEVAEGRLTVAVDDRRPTVRPSFLTISYTVDVAPNGDLWIGNVDGATRFRDGVFEFFPLEGAARCCSVALTVDPDGAVWLLQDRRLDRLRDGVWTSIDEVPTGDGPAALLATPDGAVWVFHRSETHRFEAGTWTSYSPAWAAASNVPSAQSYGFRAVEAAGGVVVTTDPLYRFSDGTWEQLPTDGFTITSRGMDWHRRGVAVGADGSVWVPVARGLAHLVPPS